MNLSDAPKKQPVPFGVNGQREELLATTPAGNQQASYDVGFPAITMLLKSAGGLPPKGQDFNQILYELASIARWAGAGGNYQFDSAFSTAVSGYPVGATVLSSDGAGFWLNGTNGNTTNPEAADYTLTGWVPVDHVGITALTGLVSSTVTLSSLQAAKDVITLSGALAANINLILPAWKKKWKIINNCTGAFTVTVKTNSGTGVAVATSTSMDLRGDGTNIVDANANLALTGVPSGPTAAAGTNTTQLATTAFVGNAITAASGRLLNNGPLLFTTPGVTTYTPSALMKFCIVEVLGAGGGSGGCPATSASQIAAAAGGAGGSWARVSLTAAQVGSSQAVTVGAGGAAGTTSGSGGVGGSSSFGTLIVCPGGTATLVGVVISTSTASVISGANPGGVPTIISGTIIESMNGMAGGNAYLSFSNVLSGIGGASPRGNGGNGISGVTASGYGSGGSGNGSTASQSAKTGQAGTGGYVAIWEYA